MIKSRNFKSWIEQARPRSRLYRIVAEAQATLAQDIRKNIFAEQVAASRY